MKNIFNLLTVFLVVITIFTACEDSINPISGIPTSDLFVRYGSATLDTVNLTEGKNYNVVLLASVSAREDLLVTLSLSGNAVFSTDFNISAGTAPENHLVSLNATKVVVRIPFVPTMGQDLAIDQTTLRLVFPKDGTIDGAKQFIMTLESAVGASNATIQYAGGQGPIQKVLVVNIADFDK